MTLLSIYLISGLLWIFASMLFAVADRLPQRMILAKEQRPVYISLTGVTMISNAWEFLILLFGAWLKDEFEEVPLALSAAHWPLDLLDCRQLRGGGLAPPSPACGCSVSSLPPASSIS